MTASWTFYVALLTVANIIACVWLLWWTARRRKGAAPEPETTGHVWDEDLTEYNKPMPRWWLNLFYATIVFGIGYLVVFPGLGGFEGTAGWSSERKHAQELAEAEAKLRPVFERFAARPVAELAQDPHAVTLGRGVYANHCATCHGSDARGARGFPNLTDADWLYGGEPDTVLATVLDGRRGAMPPLGTALGDKGVTETAVYVQQLAGRPADAALAAAGKARFETLCAACHARDGRGNVALGAPNLTDDVWLYGGDFDSIAASIRDGRNGQMPAHRALIGEERARLAAAFVVAQSRTAKAAAAGTASGSH